MEKEELVLSSNLTLEEVEKQYIMKTLQENNWNKSKSSRILGIDRTTLHLKLKRYGVKKEN
ncbi:MAG: helix-turn-helix domain-containing protein [bacterium]|nr:helix-turn-helix domain-containing protein [bacterium]